MENKFLTAMQFRHATKEFDSTKKISDEDFATILEIGRLSPSSFGFEPWKFVILQDQALREKVKTIAWGCQGQALTASHFVLILARKKAGMLYSSNYIQHMLTDVKHLPEDVVKQYRGFYENFQKVDFNLLESDRALFDWSCRQTYIPLANMMTGAAYINIDSCPMEGFDTAKMEAFLRDDLKIDTEEFGASVMVAFGYRLNAPKEKARQELDAITAWYK